MSRLQLAGQTGLAAGVIWHCRSAVREKAACTYTAWARREPRVSEATARGLPLHLNELSESPLLSDARWTAWADFELSAPSTPWSNVRRDAVTSGDGYRSETGSPVAAVRRRVAQVELSSEGTRHCAGGPLDGRGAPTVARSRDRAFAHPVRLIVGAGAGHPRDRRSPTSTAPATQQEPLAVGSGRWSFVRPGLPWP